VVHRVEAEPLTLLLLLLLFVAHSA